MTHSTDQKMKQEIFRRYYNGRTKSVVKVKKEETPAPAVGGALRCPACHNASGSTENIDRFCGRNVGRG